MRRSILDIPLKIEKAPLYGALSHILHNVRLIFFHPDFTVGFGITPNQPIRLAGFTAGRESHPAPKTIYLVESGELRIES